MASNLLRRARVALEGPIVPVTTPLTHTGEIDTEGLARLVKYYVEHGTRSMIIAGTTGYCYALEESEHRRVVETAVQAAGGNAFIIAGVSHSGTRLANRLAGICEEAGADALLSTAPYYGADVCTPEGAYRHYKTIAESHDVGLIVYNRRPVVLDVPFFDRLRDIEQVVCVKDALGDYNFSRELCLEGADRYVIMSGGSMRFYMWHWLWGAPCFVSSVGNLVPEIEQRFFDHLKRKEIEAAREIIVRYEQPLMRFIGEYGWHECLHCALKVFGLPAGGLRYPLVEPPQSLEDAMRAAFEANGLLEYAPAYK